jgi:hypothetical protein
MKDLERTKSWNNRFNAPDDPDFSLLLKQLATRTSRVQSHISQETKESNLQKFSSTKLLKCFPEVAKRREILRNFEVETVRKRIARGDVEGGAWDRSGLHYESQSSELGPGCYNTSMFDEGKYMRPKTSTPKYSDPNKVSEGMKFERRMKAECVATSNGLNPSIQNIDQNLCFDNKPSIDHRKLHMKFLSSNRWNDSTPPYFKTTGLRLAHDYDKKMDKHIQFSLGSNTKRDCTSAPTSPFMYNSGISLDVDQGIICLFCIIIDILLYLCVFTVFVYGE